MIVKEFRELIRDRRTVGLLVGMPLILLVVFGYAANFYVDHLSAAVMGPQAQQVVDALPDFFEVATVDADASRASKSSTSVAPAASRSAYAEPTVTSTSAGARGARSGSITLRSPAM